MSIAVPERVLVVDDEKAIVRLCIEILENEGYEVEGAQSGQAAINLVRNQHFDLLLTDFKMPGYDGMETLHAIKEINPEITGVVITGYASMYTAIEAIKTGFFGFIIKPFTYHELTNAVSQALKRSKLEKELIAY